MHSRDRRYNYNSRNQPNRSSASYQNNYNQPADSNNYNQRSPNQRSANQRSTHQPFRSGFPQKDIYGETNPQPDPQFGGRIHNDKLPWTYYQGLFKKARQNRVIANRLHDGFKPASNQYEAQKMVDFICYKCSDVGLPADVAVVRGHGKTQCKYRGHKFLEHIQMMELATMALHGEEVPPQSVSFYKTVGLGLAFYHVQLCDTLIFQYCRNPGSFTPIERHAFLGVMASVSTHKGCFKMAAMETESIKCFRLLETIAGQLSLDENALKWCQVYLVWDEGAWAQEYKERHGGDKCDLPHPAVVNHRQVGEDQFVRRDNNKISVRTVTPKQLAATGMWDENKPKPAALPITRATFYMRFNQILRPINMYDHKMPVTYYQAYKTGFYDKPKQHILSDAMYWEWLYPRIARDLPIRKVHVNGTNNDAVYKKYWSTGTLQSMLYSNWIKLRKQYLRSRRQRKKKHRRKQNEVEQKVEKESTPDTVDSTESNSDESSDPNLEPMANSIAIKPNKAENYLNDVKDKKNDEEKEDGLTAKNKKVDPIDMDDDYLIKEQHGDTLQ